MFARITFPISSFQTFTYSIPVEYQKQVTTGSCVHTTMGNRKLTGYVVAIEKNTSFSGKIKDISGIHDSELNLPKELWKTLEWMSKYYITPLGQVLKAAIPQRIQFYSRNFFDIFDFSITFLNYLILTI